MTKSLTFLLVLLLSLSACNDNPFVEEGGLRYLEPAEFPEQKVAVFSSLYTSSSLWHFGEEEPSLKVVFNAADYPNAKEIYFQAELSSTDPEFFAYGRVFNVTDGEPITGSVIRNTWGISRSENLLGFFPDKEIELTLQGRNDQEGATAQIWANSFIVVVLE